MAFPETYEPSKLIVGEIAISADIAGRFKSKLRMFDLIITPLFS